MKHAFQLASASVVALFAASAQAVIPVETFSINFEDYTNQAKPSGAVSGGTWSNGGDSYVETDSNNKKQLVIDAERTDALTFAPSNTTTAVSMDVQFVGASEAPATSLEGTQAALYLHKTSGLQVSVAGGDFTAFVDDTTKQAPTVAETTWYKLTITFAYGTGTTIVLADAQGTTLATYKSASTVSGKSGVVGVDFYGFGRVDNFVGNGPLVPQTDNGTTEGDDSSDMTISGTTLTTQFAAKKDGADLKFITVTDATGKTRTLRVPANNQGTQLFNTSSLGNITKVVAYYGDKVTATVGAVDDATVPTLDSKTHKVSGSVTAKSGVYYALSVNGQIQPLKHDNAEVSVSTPIPETVEDDYTLSYEISPESTGYGVVKFKIVASDDPVTAQ